MEDILQTLNEPISQITALGVVLVFYALCYSVRLAGGKRRTKKQKIKWSWERFWNDLHFRIWVGYALVASVVAIDLAQWLMPLIGVTVSAETAALLNANIIISLPFVAGLNELVSGVKLLWKVWKYQENLETLGATVDPDSADISEIASDTQKLVEQIIEYVAPAVEPDQSVKALPKKEATKAIEDAQLGASVPVAAILEQLKSYATKNAFLKEDGSSGIYRGQCTQVPAFVYNQVGVYGSMGNGKDVVKNLIARGVAEACGEEPGAIASADDGSTYGHTWVSLGNGYLIEQNARVAGTSTANYGVGTVYSCRVGRLNEWNRGKVTYCRLKGLLADNPVPKEESSATTETPAEDVIKYTYKQGDTFGQVITDLGLKTSHGLWGEDGDVAYYTAQLREQGITSNIPVGKTITLRRRK